MDNRVSLQPAYVLHRRPFQNSSLLIDFFTLEHGRVRAIAKGARGGKSRYRSLLQLFTPILISFSGRGEVKTVTGVETQLSPISLQGDHLFSGLYINELLTRLLHNHQEHSDLYQTYQHTLLAMQAREPIERVLRRFELNLLADLGYGLNLMTDCRTQRAIDPQLHYYFQPDIGFSVDDLGGSQDNEHDLISGAHIIALQSLDLQDMQAAKTAKRILRMALAEHLGDKPLASRSLFSGRA